MEMSQSVLLKIGKMHYNVSNLDRASFFFEQALGMKQLEKTPNTITLGTETDQALFVLHKVNNPPPRKKTTGLFHVAIRFPHREDLARLIYHLVNNQVDIQGTAEHGVSEAIYLTGPEEMGIELTCDRDYDEWPIDEEGNLDMVTEELDIENLIMTIQGKAKKWTGLPAGTTIGHVHLKVTELEKTAEFYTALGLEITQEYGDQALFFASGDYHHHVGTNTWESAGADPLPPDTAGLNAFEIIFPDQTSLKNFTTQLKDKGISIKEDDVVELIDPNGIRVLLIANQ